MPLEPKIRLIDPAEAGRHLVDLLAPGEYRWAVFDRQDQILFVGTADIKTHLGVAERARLLSRSSDTYRPGGLVVGGFVCRSLDAHLYFDPFSGTFPGSPEGIHEAHALLERICEEARWPYRCYDDIAPERRVTHGMRGTHRNSPPA